MLVVISTHSLSVSQTQVSVQFREFYACDLFFVRTKLILLYHYIHNMNNIEERSKSYQVGRESLHGHNYHNEYSLQRFSHIFVVLMPQKMFLILIENCELPCTLTSRRRENETRNVTLINTADSTREAKARRSNIVIRSHNYELR